MDDPVLGRRASLASAFVMHVAGQHALVAFAADSEMPAIFEDAEACNFNFGFRCGARKRPYIPPYEFRC